MIVVTARYSSVVTMKTSKVLMVSESISRVWLSSSGTEMVDATDENKNKLMNWFVKGGMTIRNAWGMRMYR